MSDIRVLWAKSNPYHPLWCHLLDVGAVAQTIAPLFGGVPGLPPEFVAFMAAIHDVGKADPVFQFQVQDEQLTGPLRSAGLMPETIEGRTGYRHEARSSLWLRDWLQRAMGWDSFTANELRRVPIGHHGNFNAKDVDDGKYLQLEAWQSLRDELGGRVAETLGVTPFPEPADLHWDVTGVKLTALTVLADWIASDHRTYNYPALSAQHTDLGAYYAAAREHAQAVIDRLAFAREAPPVQADARLADLFPWLAGRALTPVQDAIELDVTGGRLSPGLTIIEAPMGHGKTEAAIYLAEHWLREWGTGGIYFALPTQATSNQIHSRLAAYLHSRYPDNPEPRLVHGMAWLVDRVGPEAQPETWGDDDEPAESYDWFRSTRRALLAPDGVGTIDQALFTALNGKFGFLRLLGLGRSVLIVDEAHAYDAYISTILTRLIEWRRAMGAPVIVLSATLPSATRRRLLAAWGAEGDDRGADGYPLITHAGLADWRASAVAVSSPVAAAKTVHLRVLPGMLDDYEGIAARAVAAVTTGGCACVIMNTVKGAQAVYRALMDGPSAVPPAERFLFHARFPAGRRSQIEQEITSRFGRGEDALRPHRAILVATQVVEQSLDVDFDVMFSQIAPIDLLLQRSGRLWRHDRGPLRHGISDPVLHVFTPPEGTFEFGLTGYVYDAGPEVLLRTLAVLQERTGDTAAFDIPHDLRGLIDQVYGDEPWPVHRIPDDLLKAALTQQARKRAIYEGESHRQLIPPPNADEFAFAENGRSAPESEEGAPKSYLQVATRYSGSTQTAIVITDEDLAADVRGMLARTEGSPRWRPHLDDLRRIYVQKVNLPSWWLNNATSGDGSLVVTEPRHWLRGAAVLFMPEHRLRIPKADGTAVTVIEDALLGIYAADDMAEQDAW